MTTTMITQELEAIESKYNDLLQDNESLRLQLKAVDQDNVDMLDDLARKEAVINGLKQQLEDARNAL